MASENAQREISTKRYLLNKLIKRINMSIETMKVRHTVELTILSVITVISFLVTFA